MTYRRRRVPFAVARRHGVAAVLVGLRAAPSRVGSQPEPRSAPQRARSPAGSSAGPRGEHQPARREHQLPGVTDSLVQSREAAARESLAADRARLAQLEGQISREREHLAMLRKTLAKAKDILSAQVVSRYESQPPDLVSVVLNAHGFNDLLEQIAFLGRAEKQQQSIIPITEAAKAAADAAVKRLTGLQATDAQITAETAVRAQALAGMNQLLSSREAALSSARSAQRGAGGQPGPQPMPWPARSRTSRPSRPPRGPPRRARAAASRCGRRHGPVRRSARPAAGRSRTRSCCASPAARTCPPTARAPRATTRSSPAPGSFRRRRPRGLPGEQGRAGRGRVPDLEGRRRRVELGLRRDRRDPLTRLSRARARQR